MEEPALDSFFIAQARPNRDTIPPPCGLRGRADVPGAYFARGVVAHGVCSDGIHCIDPPLGFASRRLAYAPASRASSRRCERSAPTLGRVARTFDRQRVHKAIMRFLVTGGSGFVGSRLSRALIENGHEVTILDLVVPPTGLENAHVVQGDIRDRFAVERAVLDCDEVFHLAAAHHDYGIERTTYFSVNEHGTEVLCQAMTDHGIRNICFFSSVAVYGTGIGCRDETATLNPASSYGESKRAAENVLKTWVSGESGRRVIALRPAAIFGPGTFANMYSLIRQISTGWFVPVGSGRNIKSLAYVDNVVNAAVNLRKACPQEPYEVYNYADEPALSTRALIHIIHEELGRPFPRYRVPLWLARLLCFPLDVISSVVGKNFPVSTERINKFAAMESHFTSSNPKRVDIVPIPLEEGVRRTVQWYLHHGYRQRAVHSIPPAEVWRAALEISSLG